MPTNENADTPHDSRDDVVAAFEKHEAEVAPPETPAPDAAAPEAVETTSAADPAAAPAEPQAPKAPDAAQGQPAAPETPAPAAKPPRSWSAEAKAEFGKLPVTVQQEVLRREKEISQGLERVAPARQFYEKFSEVTKPFEPLLKAYNVDPVDAVQTLFATRAALEIGNPEQKAQIVANIIHDFGIDVQTLDNLLVQRGPVQPFRAAPPPPPPQRDPEIQALLDTIKAAQVKKAQAAIDEASSLPHFEELREDIADIVEAFHKAGKTISLEAAHKRALAMNPDLEPVPAAPPQISKSQAAAILASRNAASSVSGAPRPSTVPEAQDRRSQIAAAWDQARR